MKIEILDEAQEDLLQGFRFYEDREPMLGAYFLDCLFSDIDSLLLYAGVHAIVFTYHRCLSKRFPFAFITQWKERLFVYMLSWIVAEGHHGLEIA